MISQFFVLSQRGDNIVFRDYRGDVQKGSAEIFFRKVKFWKEDGETEAPPVFNVDGVNYFHVKVVGLLFVATTRANVSPSLVFELLQRIARVTKDYLGILNEDSIRKNFVLMYELLDEVIDFGYVQTTSTEVLKSCVFNEPIMIDATHMPPLGPAALFMQGNKRMPGTAEIAEIAAGKQVFIEAKPDGLASGRTNVYDHGNVRNKLIKFELLKTTATFLATVFAVVTAVFGVNKTYVLSMICIPSNQPV